MKLTIEYSDFEYKCLRELWERDPAGKPQRPFLQFVEFLLYQAVATRSVDVAAHRRVLLEEMRV